MTIHDTHFHARHDNDVHHRGNDGGDLDRSGIIYPVGYHVWIRGHPSIHGR